MAREHRSVLLACLLALPAAAGAGDVVINEIHHDPPDRTKLEEFVELYNAGASSADLSGWYFSSGIDYEFPPGTVLAAGGYLLVAKKPEAWPGLSVPVLGPFDGYLASEGELLVLRNPRGEIEDQVDYGVGFPWPSDCAGGGGSMELIHPSLDNDLGGSWRASSGSTSLPDEPITVLGAGDPEWHFRKGTSEASDPPSLWREPGFVEDGTWLAGRTSIGYGDDDDATVLDDMMDGYTSVYLRREFRIDGDAPPPALALRMYVDDGSIVWLNGVEVARFHISAGEKTYADRAYGHEARWEELLLTDARRYLVAGANLIAIHAFNQTVAGNDFSIDAELVIPARGVLPSAPSPGERNTAWAEQAPPQIRQVEHVPAQPLSGTAIPVTAKVTDPEGVRSVSLRYQVVPPGGYIPAYLPLPYTQLLATPDKPREPNPAFEDPAGWATLPMADDGVPPDAMREDGIYTGSIPAQAHRTLVRYRIEASDSLGASVVAPYRDDPSLNFACFVYDAVPPYVTTRMTVRREGVGYAYPPGLLTSIPVHWLITRAQDLSECIAYSPTYQIPKSNEGARDAFNWEGAWVHEGVVYDHVNYRLRQANDRYGGGGKRSMRIRFHKGRWLEARDDWGRPFATRWRTLNTGKMFDNLRVGNFGLTETANNILWNLVGVPAPLQCTFHLRVVDGPHEAPAGTNGQYYGDFWGMFLGTEDYDPRFLDAHGLPDGNLYKLKDGIFAGNLLKRNQGRLSVTTDADFQNIRANLRPTQPAAWLDRHVRYERWYPYHAVVEAIRHYDFVPADSHSKNRAWFFEPAEGTPFGLLWTLPHDADASWGPNWNEGIDYSFNAIRTGADKAPFRQEYRNAIREFRDLVWRPEVIEPLIDELAALVGEFSQADRDRWRNAPADAGSQDFGPIETKVRDMKNFAFVGWSGSTGPTVPAGGRAAYLDQLHRAEGDSTAMPAKPTVTPATSDGFPADRLVFETTAFSDPQGEANFAGLEWRVGKVGGGEPPSRPGMPPERFEWDAVWLSGAIAPFEPRATVPAWAVEVGSTYRVRSRFRDTTGRVGHWSDPVEFTVGAPEASIPQVASLRVTEIMYHPLGDEDFEYVEIQNVGDAPVDLAGVRLGAGVECAVEGGSGSLLPPGEYAVFVRSRRVFGSRYGVAGIRIAGEYTGRLSNAGERLTLWWGNLAIQSFVWSDRWHPTTDGTGRSLVAVDAGGPLEAWGREDGWRESADPLGSPGAPDGGFVAGGRVLPGDVTADGRFDISDPISLLGFLFLGSPSELPCGNGNVDEPGNAALADVDGDGKVALTDAVMGLEFLFRGGPPPALGTACVRLEGCREACAD